MSEALGGAYQAGVRSTARRGFSEPTSEIPRQRAALPIADAQRQRCELVLGLRCVAPEFDAARHRVTRRSATPHEQLSRSDTVAEPWGGVPHRDGWGPPDRGGASLLIQLGFPERILGPRTPTYRHPGVNTDRPKAS
jgi:hypothetical protein